MDQSKKITRKLYDIISDSLSEIGSFISRNDEFHSPKDQSDGHKDNSFSQPFDQSLELRESETVMLSKDEYTKLKSDLSVLEESLHSSSKQNDEYKKLLLDYDATMTYILEKEESMNAEALSRKLEEKEETLKNLEAELKGYKEREACLKNYIDAMQKDLEKALERAELYKIFGKEKIKELEDEKDRMIEAERQKNDELCVRIDELMKVVEERSADNMELIEYCRYFMSAPSK